MWGCLGPKCVSDCIVVRRFNWGRSYPQELCYIIYSVLLDDLVWDAHVGEIARTVWFCKRGRLREGMISQLTHATSK